jgi:Skp family chaperone for outer membrane proteins
MKRLVIAAFIVMAFASSSFAQEVKVGVIDFSRVIMSSTAGQKAQAEMEALEKDRTDKLKPKRDAFVKLQQDFVAQERVLSDDAKRTKIAEIQQKQAELEGLTRQYTAEMQQKNAEATDRIMKEAQAVISQVANDRGLTLILATQTVIYSKDLPNITEDVLTRYNNQYK